MKSAQDIQFAENNRDEIVSSITMIIILVSFSMLFATLFLAYAIYRLGNPVWPPMGMAKVNLLLPSISTFIACSSSFLFYLFFKDLKRENLSFSKSWLTLSLLAGIGFLVVQFQLWSALKLSGMLASSGIFGSLNYAFTWIHAAHIFLGLILLIWLRFNFKKVYMLPAKYLISARNVGKFWHFLTIVWLLIYVFIFVV